MKSRLQRIERRIGRKNDETSGIVAVVCDDGAIVANGRKYANQAKFTQFCAKSGANVVLYLPDNGRDTPK